MSAWLGTDCTYGLQQIASLNATSGAYYNGSVNHAVFVGWQPYVWMLYNIDPVSAVSICK